MIQCLQKCSIIIQKGRIQSKKKRNPVYNGDKEAYPRTRIMLPTRILDEIPVEEWVMEEPCDVCDALFEHVLNLKLF